MQLTARTSARAKTWNDFDEWARAEADQWGWDHLLLETHEVMGVIRKPSGATGCLWMLGNSEGWPSVLRRIAELMEEVGVQCDVFEGTRLEREQSEQPVAVGATGDAVDPVEERSDDRGTTDCPRADLSPSLFGD